jgi:hypothetical protein
VRECSTCVRLCVILCVVLCAIVLLCSCVCVCACACCQHQAAPVRVVCMCLVGSHSTLSTHLNHHQQHQHHHHPTQLLLLLLCLQTGHTGGQPLGRCRSIPRILSTSRRCCCCCCCCCTATSGDGGWSRCSGCCDWGWSSGPFARDGGARQQQQHTRRVRWIALIIVSLLFSYFICYDVMLCRHTACSLGVLVTALQHTICLLRLFTVKVRRALFHHCCCSCCCCRCCHCRRAAQLLIRLHPKALLGLQWRWQSTATRPVGRVGFPTCCAVAAAGVASLPASRDLEVGYCRPAARQAKRHRQYSPTAMRVAVLEVVPHWHRS